MICASLWLEVAMSDVVLLTKQQLNRIKPYFPDRTVSREWMMYG